MPLFKLKKTLLLSTTIATTALFAGCGGGGSDSAGPAPEPCDSSFTGASAVVIDSYSVEAGLGTLKGRVTDSSKLESVQLSVRGQGESSLEAKIDKTVSCKKFTIDNIPLAKTVSDYRLLDKNDAEADYTLTVVNNAAKTTVKTFLAAGSELQTVTAMQLNNSVFEGENGIVKWLEGVLSAYDIQTFLAKTSDSNGVPKKPYVYAAAGDLAIPGNITDDIRRHALLHDNQKIESFILPIMDKQHIGNDFYIYLTRVSFGGENADADNGARITMQVNAAEKEGDSGFDIDTTVVFNGGIPSEETIISARIISVKSDSDAIAGITDIDFVIPDLSFKVVMNVSNEDVITDASSLLSFLGNQSNLTPQGLFQLSSGSKAVADFFSAVKVVDCESLCENTDPADWVGKLDRGISSFVSVQDAFLSVLDPIDDQNTSDVDESAGSIANRLRNVLATVNENLVSTKESVFLSDSSTKKMTVTSTKGRVLSVRDDGNTVTGGFISAGGSALYDEIPDPIVNHAIGSIYEPGISSVIAGGDLAGAGGVVIAVSEAAINQALLARFESDLLLSKQFDFKAKELVSIAGIDPDDDVFVTTELGSAPYVDVGSKTNNVKAVMEGLSLKIYLKPKNPDDSLIKADEGDVNGKIHILTLVLSPVGEMEYGIVDGLPKVKTPVAIDLKISSMTIENSAVESGLSLVGKDAAWLKNQISSSVKTIIQQEVAKLGNIFAESNRHSKIDLKPTSGSLPDELAEVLPTTLHVVLNPTDGISSDVDGKLLLLNGGFQVINDAKKKADALYSFTLFDSSESK